jgi:aminoglycoside N3'-acetyltransferase
MAQSLLTRSEIVRGLLQLGVSRGATVEVHSSLRAFGRVEGGAQTVIAALLEVLTAEGTLVMSAYPVSPPVALNEEDRRRGIAWKVRVLPLDARERTGMGAVADALRQRPDVVCGRGFFRTCAWGRDAAAHGEGYAELLARSGCCLLLGVGIDRCSSMHAAEESPLPAEVGACWRIPEEVRRAYDAAQWNIGYGGPPEDAWRKVWESADRRGLVRHGRIGSAACHYFGARAVVGLYRDWRQADPYGLYGVPRPA